MKTTTTTRPRRLTRQDREFLTLLRAFERDRPGATAAIAEVIPLASDVPREDLEALFESAVGACPRRGEVRL